MLLDYYFSRKRQELSFSYIKDDGMKGILSYKVGKFKHHEAHSGGTLTNWDGRKVVEKYADKPSTFDTRLFISSLSEDDQSKLFANNLPRLWTFDIEVDYDEGVFPDPAQALFPILTIAVVDDKMNCMVLGTGQIKDPMGIESKINAYISQSSFYQSLHLAPSKFTYKAFSDERSMLEFFLKSIVAKVPILAGWNSLLFDWQYIQNRIYNEYKDLSLACSSCIWACDTINKFDLRDNKIRLNMPKHTAILDMMDIIGNFDMAVMPQKESLSLEYIASESPVGLGKVKYDGDLKHLYNTNYDEYVYYNVVDSILVQLIDQCFKTMNNIYAQANYARIPVEKALSKIALSDALFWDYFHGQGTVVVPVERVSERGELVGAYVKEPRPGKYKWVCCNDFSSLYPSTIITCNISVENFIGQVDDIEKYKGDSNYFVSVNGNVYRNDQDYAFKIIQQRLKTERASAKYIAKELTARVVNDLEHLISGKKYDESIYSDSIIAHIQKMGYDYKYTSDIGDPAGFLGVLKKEITYLVSYEQACKLLANSLYGGSSHVSSAFFNIALANDITGEARHLIKKFETHIPELFEKYWYTMTDLHQSLGITVKPGYTNLVQTQYMDTDSGYFVYDNLVKTFATDSTTLDEIRNVLIRLNREFLDVHNKAIMDRYYASRFAKNIHEFELETIAYSGVWLNIKKRYAQVLCWQDGRLFDWDELPIKAKGLEIIKASYPSLARGFLKKMMDVYIKNDDPMDTLNIMNQEFINKWSEALPDDICPTSSCKNYDQYVFDDKTLRLAGGTPFVVRGVATYNYTRQKYGLSGSPLYGGKVRYYYCKDNNKNPRVFAFSPNDYQQWMDKYAPIDRKRMYEKCVLDPMNRILEAVGDPILHYDGFMVQDLFGF